MFGFYPKAFHLLKSIELHFRQKPGRDDCDYYKAYQQILTDYNPMNIFWVDQKFYL